NFKILCLPLEMSFDQDVNSYSPEGRIYQIEYAMMATNHGVTTLAVTTNNSVIVISEKKLISKLQVSKNTTKHFKIDKHIGMSFSGIMADAHVIIDKSRSLVYNYKNKYNEKLTIIGLLKGLSEQSLQFSEKDFSKRIFSRPFGVSVLIASYENIPKLYIFDPSGSYIQYKAKSIGNASQVIDDELKIKYNQELSDKDAIISSLKILKEVMKEKMQKENIEIMVVDKNGVHFFTEEKVQEYITVLGSK
ncbi:proteasome subunit alpha type-5, partial [Pseudoloma neurophilia]